MGSRLGARGRRGLLQGAHGLTDALRDAELLARAVVAVVVDGAPAPEAFADYEARRDALSTDLFDVTDEIARHRWTDAEIAALLLRLNAAMRDEVDALTALRTTSRATGRQ